MKTIDNFSRLYLFSNLRRLTPRIACGAVLSWMLAITAIAAEPSNSPILGRQLSEFHVTEYRGASVRQADFWDKRLLVVAFLGVDCPLAKRYTQRLNELNAEYSPKGVAVLGIDANVQDSLMELTAHARVFNVSFQLAKDASQDLVRQLGATRTPEVFVLDSQRVVRYYGRIDDQFGIGFAREKPSKFELRDALDELLADKPVSNPHVSAAGCLIGRIQQPKVESSVTYCKDIAPIFRDSCVQCHRDGEIGPFAMSSYEEVMGWAEMIAEVVQEKRMPPWHASPEYGQFVNDCSLSKEQIDKIIQWVDQGAAQGDPNDLPKPKRYIAGWQLPREPDLVLNVSPRPFKVPADGEVKYQYFRVDPGFEEDKWISAAQLIPGNREVVHHILVFARPKGERGGLKGERGFLLGYVPGSIVNPFPEGMAKRIPAGSELIFQVHYTPIGTPQEDQSRVAFLFADPRTIQQEVQTTSAVQHRLKIPAGEADYRASAMLPEKLPESLLLSMSPHMHVRGKSFRYTAIFPDGQKKILLDVPKYDFNWQTGYRLAEPMPMPAGSKIFCEASFDNSSNNPNNPDPQQTVSWGDQTSDEMMIGYFDIVFPRGESGVATTRTGVNDRRGLIAELVKQGLFNRLDVNQDKRIERSELPERWRKVLDEHDRNRDGYLTQEEIE